ncbi:DNA internalization-related competence Rec2 with Metallo-beta-lactamase superfamily domain-containing protein [Babesia ovata]|uniref:DNA internalization-related competence Rec2 with Metallo-beta-lactamase superfamily domain-containing protein n=1 Tax=Babesia ovata TaxID=189622 RepID=A0A2H6KF50_9APIC|nr:DNA internalization-related competence Rec2 with Metallo-beta-lactamase superfamily domain-containing protein [Babesia ovata]GBE61607.1 DNA internalization-related competence Rec2 with Metallo-beta-lactamase superfamily domain-containing protein [Babesia ovata]
MGLFDRISGFVTAGIKAARTTFSGAATRGIGNLADSALEGLDVATIKDALETPSVQELVDSVIQTVMWHVWISYVIPMMLIMTFFFALFFAAFVYGWLNRCSAGFMRFFTMIAEMIMYGYWKSKKSVDAFWADYSEIDDSGLLSKFRGHRYLPAAYAKCKLR